MRLFNALALRPRYWIWILLVLVSWGRLSIASTNYKILIDPGHGGRDVGAYVSGFKESEIVWKWALALKRDLIDKGLKVELTRAEAGPITRHDRIRKAQAAQFDFVISLHANYFLDPRIRGVEYFILNPLNWEDQKLEWAHEETERTHTLRLKSAKADKSVESFSKQAHITTIVEDLKKQARMKKSYELAQLLQQQWNGRLKQGSFEILSHAQSPAVLIELGFLSSPVDQKNLIDPEFINYHSSLLAHAIHRYFHDRSPTKINP